MRGLLMLLGWLATAGPAVALPPAAMCDAAAAQVAAETDVPLDVLRAITRTETGRSRNGTVEPWPWTVNMEGKGVWFDTEDPAQAYVDRHFSRGARSFDVGCFQINYKWHGRAFESVEAMFDPLTNARYAARFLAELFAETGDWSAAAGAYHSRTPKYAKRYRARFDRLRRNLDPPVQLAATPVPSAPRPFLAARAPLFEAPAAASSARLGSLFPLAQGG